MFRGYSGSLAFSHEGGSALSYSRMGSVNITALSNMRFSIVAFSHPEPRHYIRSLMRGFSIRHSIISDEFQIYFTAFSHRGFSSEVLSREFSTYVLYCTASSIYSTYQKNCVTLKIMYDTFGCITEVSNFRLFV